MGAAVAGTAQARYYQASRHAAWHRIARTTTGAGGTFMFSLTGRPAGRYRVSYHGGGRIGRLGTILATTSRPIRYA